jgi:chromosome segregation ATPase
VTEIRGQGDFDMKSWIKTHKKCFFIGWVGVLIFSLCFSMYSPNKVVAEGETGDSGNSGGFLVEADKVEGTMDVLKIITEGEAAIGEGIIYGLTMTKTLATDKGNLTIKIKSPGPINVENLVGKLIGLPVLGGVCTPSKVGWACMTDVKMTLSDQTADAIDLPNATVETCLNDQCQDVSNLAKALLATKTPEEIKKELPSLQKDLEKAADLIEQAKDLADQIEKDNAIDAVNQSIEKAKKLVTSPNPLKPVADQIGNTYDQLLKASGDWGANLDEANQLLDQVGQQIEQDEKVVKNMPQLEALSKNLATLKKQLEALKDNAEKLSKQQKQYQDRLDETTKQIEALRQLILSHKNVYDEALLQTILDALSVGILDQAPGNLQKNKGSGSINEDSSAKDQKQDTNQTDQNTSPTDTTSSKPSDQGTTNDTSQGQPDSKAELKKQWQEALQNGMANWAAIKPNLDKAKDEIETMDHLADELTHSLLIILNRLDPKKAKAFDSHLDALETHMEHLDGQVSALKTSISKAAELEKQLGISSKDLQTLKSNLAELKSLKTSLHQLETKLNALPEFKTIDGFIDRIKNLQSDMGAW